MKNNLPFINVYEKNSTKSKVATQLLYGDTFKCLKKNKYWIKIKNDSDDYIGFIKNKKFSINEKNTHKIFNLKANLYSKPNIKNIVTKKLSFGSKIRIVDKKKNFYKFDSLWVKKNDLKKINFKTKNIFNNIKKFSNVKYRWGRKHFSGIDCSALVQLCFNFNNKYCPRDTKDQVKFFKKNINLKKIKKNDLIFWKGHVAVIISKNKLIHAYGPKKKVVIMPIKKTIKIIYKSANLKVIGIKRFK